MRARRRARPASSATAASSTPAASPRQPACAAATTLPRRSAKSTGRQSAVSTAHTCAGRARDRAVGGGCARRAARRRWRSPSPCTCASHSGSPGRKRRSGARAAAHPSRSRAKSAASAADAVARGRECAHRAPAPASPERSSRARRARIAPRAQRQRASELRRAAQVSRAARRSRAAAAIPTAPASCVDGWTSPRRQRVQRLPPERDAALLAIRRIADQRMSERGEMHADLVRAAGLEPAGEQRAIAEALAHVVVRARGFPAGDDRHRRAPHRMAADRRIDRAAAGDVAGGERQIFAVHAVAPAAGARDRSARLRSWRRPGARSCPCRGDGRCPRARRRRAAARGAAARSRACRRGCRCPDERRGPAGLSITSSASSSCTIVSGSACGANEAAARIGQRMHQDIARRRRPCGSRPPARPSSVRGRRRSRSGGGCANARAAAARAPGRAACPRTRPEAVRRRRLARRPRRRGYNPRLRDGAGQ